jgi:glycosyltransferase involved in cell wall biosynthesis
MCLRISALIPTYNRRAQVMCAVDSVLAQTVPPDEVIVIDDGSTDGTAEAIRSTYGARVTLFRQQNAGVSAARNRGLREAQGEWIAFLDSDDIWLPTKIEQQIEALSSLGSEFGLCFTDCVYHGNAGLERSVFEETGLTGTRRFGSLDDPAKYIMASREPFWTQSLMLQRSLLEESNGFDESLTLREDTDVLFRLSFRTKFCFVTEPLVLIDRSPWRDGLCNLYAMADDRMFDSVERLYTKWLAMPEVGGTGYEQPIREMLRSVRFDSAEAKIRQFRVAPALREMSRLRAMGDSYPSLLGALLLRKAKKLRRGVKGSKRHSQRTSADRHLDLA